MQSLHILEDMNPVQRRRSLLELDPGRSYEAALKLGLFTFFIATRAIHPLVIESSKEGGSMLYAKNSVVVASNFGRLVLMNLVAFSQGGWQGVQLCWQPRYLYVFGIIGAVYAFGDWLEMLSMAKLSGGVYQILLQTKLLITALMLWYMKGTKQTPLQGHVLCAMFLAMSAFVIQDSGDANEASGGSMSMGSIGCVMLKVAVSCFCAVLSEKYLKEFKNLPFYAKMSCLATTWTMASAFFMLTAERKVVSHGFFANWSWKTVYVVISFTVKTLSTQFLLQKLDSVQKNIGEAIAVIIIYGAQVSFSCFDKSFELSVFLVAMLMVALVKTYLLSTPKPATDKDKRHRHLRAATKRVNLVALSPKGTPLMQMLGRNTFRCEVKESLPKGIFYGMLGDVHPVCGNTHFKDPTKCELMMLSEPRADGAVMGAEASVPFLLQNSLTVLGKLREPLPKVDLTEAQLERDIEEARQRIESACMFEYA